MSTGADAATGLDDRTGELEARLARYPVDRYPVQHATTAFHLGTAHLQRGSVTQALRENLPGFVAMDVAPDDGTAAHPPPTQVLLQITPRPADL